MFESPEISYMGIDPKELSYEWTNLSFTEALSLLIQGSYMNRRTPTVAPNLDLLKLFCARVFLGLAGIY